MLNVELLHRTLAHIEAHPEQWDPREWATRTARGTAYCFASTAIMLAVPDAVFEFLPAEISYYLGGNAEFATETASIVRRADGRRARIRDAACALLGVNEDCAEARRLFNPDNTLDDLHRIIDELCAPIACTA